MLSFKHQNHDENDRPRRNGGHDLWYYERRADDRLYFRLAPLGWILLVIPVILAIGALIILFLYNSAKPVQEPHITIKPRDTSADPPTNNLIKRAPPMSAQPRVQSPSNLNRIKPIASPQPSRRPNGQ